MGTVRYRIEPNPLTKPASYKLRFMPQQVAGYNELAAAVANDNDLTTEQATAYIKSMVKNIIQMLGNGMQVTLEDGFTFFISFHARLDSPDDPIPPLEELIRIGIAATSPCVREVLQYISLERVADEEKAPMMLSAMDTNLKLADVLFAGGILKLTGSNLKFDENDPLCGCLIEGTRSGQQQQSVYGLVNNKQILVVPDIPTQEAPWNNEYTVTISTKYSEHGAVRSSTYSRKLRTPIAWDGLPHEGGIGVLTGNADVPYVAIQSGTIAADERIRLQAVYDTQNGGLVLNLLGMNDSGPQGAIVAVSTNGSYTLPGFSGSGVTSIVLTVEVYNELYNLVRNSYSGRLVDIVDIRRT